ncbi:uncharacterized protein LOC116615531 [Nematostella vectensis]|uniref:uncharacterized protein LOC116615531 n=1 Tax=Nematostella vectensis TaxID=45351 RepID=UPI0013903B7D|nr:uncharacterized protein LOC116615531 [Nematostella vectensis]
MKTNKKTCIFLSFSGALTINAWNHVIIRWDRKEKRMTIFINGTEDKSIVSSLSNVDLTWNEHPRYEIGRIKDTKTLFLRAHLNNLVIFHMSLKDNEIKWLFDSGADYKAIHGAWIGMEHIAEGDDLVWSDGAPVLYHKQFGYSSLYQCVTLGSKGQSYGGWYLNKCKMKMPFICKRSLT